MRFLPESLAALLAAVWGFGTPLMALGALVLAARALVARRPLLHRALRASGFLAVALLAVVANPFVNMGLFAGVAQRHRAEMLDDARRAGCVGKPIEWLEKRYGSPMRVRADSTTPGVEHWWYAPGPWFVVHDDYVGFSIRNGWVSAAYIQVN